MPNFDIDELKKIWKEQEIKPKYGNADILEMLSSKSRNYVKYIFWISTAEFLFFLALTVFYIFRAEENSSFLNILEKLGLHRTPELEMDFAHLFFILKIISLAITAVFMAKFWLAYRKINVESNLKNLIRQIINFRRTVNLFIFANIFSLILFTGLLTVFVFLQLSSQQIHLQNNLLMGFIIGVVISTVLCVVLVWAYYRIVYGILTRKLTKNLKQLQEIEKNGEEI